ncbi:MAG: hypothetical protein WC823_05415 [Parcubacteria group bacterium]|jgi:hypothetical protein
MSVKEQIMQKIKEEHIEMRPAYFFWMKKIGLQSLLAFSIVFGALVLNSLFYFFKKMDALGVLSLGWDGMDRLLLSLPYDYIALFIISIVLANFIIHQFDLSYQISMNTNVAVLVLLGLTFLLSAFFLISGIEDVLKFWDKDRLLKKNATSRALIQEGVGNGVYVFQAEGK